MKIKYILTEIKVIDPSEYETAEGGSRTTEEILQLIKEGIEEEPSFILDYLNDFTITIELVEE